MFLTEEELRTLTGYSQRAYQVRWLKRNGLPHWVAKGGRVIVPKEALSGNKEPDFTRVA